MKKIDITITEQQIKQIEQFNAKTGITRSEFIRRAIDEYLRRQAKKALEAIHADLRAQNSPDA